MFLFRNKPYYWRYLIKLFKKKWVKGLPYAISFMTGTYSLYKMFEQPLNAIFPALKNLHWAAGTVTLLLLFAVSYLWWLLKEFKALNDAPYYMKNGDRSVSVHVGDMFSRKNGTILVGVSNTLDPERYGPNSIHRQLAELYPKEWLRSVFQSGKQNATLEADGTYPYGYTFMGESPDGKSFAFIVMSEWNGEAPNMPPRGDREKIGRLMKELFSSQSSFARNVGANCKDYRLYMPLIGLGVTNLGLSKQQYAEWIVRQFIDKGAECQVKHLVIEFRPKTLEDRNFDYLSLNEHIRFYAEELHKPDDAMPRPMDNSRKVSRAAGV